MFDNGVSGPSTRPDPRAQTARVVQEISDLSAHIAAATSRLLELLVEVERDVLWDPDAGDAATWFSFLTGMSPRVARHHAEVAARLEEFHETKQALVAGNISFEQARAITRAATPSTEESLVELARNTTCGQLQRITAIFRRATQTEIGLANTQHARRYLSYFFDNEDGFVIRGRMPADQGAVVAQALERVTDDLSERRRTEAGAGIDAPIEAEPDAESAGANHVDALVELCRAGMSTLATGSGAGPGALPEVVVHVDEAALAGGDGDAHVDRGRCELGNGIAIAGETARRIACDASVLALLERDGAAIKAGRRRRTISHALRRALEARDRMCRFPGCSRRGHAEAHHIEHWSRGGTTDPSNLVLLCRFHHRVVHEGGYRIEGDPHATLRFVRPDGEVVKCAVSRSARMPLEDLNGARGVHPQKVDPMPEGAGHRRLDLVYITDALFFQEPVWQEIQQELHERVLAEMGPRGPD